MNTTRRILLASVALAVAGIVALPTANADGHSKKILLIGAKPDHPHGSHMYMHECGLLAKCLEQTPGVKAVVSLGWPTDGSLLDDVDAIVLYTNPSDRVITEQHRPKFMELMSRGVGYSAIHWATSAQQMENTEPYINVLGGTFNFAYSKPPLAVTKETLIRTDPDHPASNGWAAYDLRDEWYLSMKFHPQTVPLVKVRVAPDTSQQRPEPIDLTVAWTFERQGGSGGRSFGTTLGHFHDNFGIEAFRRMIVQGILWTAKVDVPPTGAPVNVEPADLILPPPPQQ